MRTLMLAGAAALALAAAPAVLAAQDAPAPVARGESTEPAPETAAEANAEAAPLPTTEEVLPGTKSNEPDLVVTTHHGNLTPPPATALNKTYPVCTRALQDGCQNPGEGGAPGRSRALGYWPGEPASGSDADRDG